MTHEQTAQLNRQLGNMEGKLDSVKDTCERLEESFDKLEARVRSQEQHEARIVGGASILSVIFAAFTAWIFEKLK